MPRILSDYDRKIAKRQVMTILNSPQGRDLGRWFLTERGKGTESNMTQVKREILDIFSDCISDLYQGPSPVQSR